MGTAALLVAHGADLRAATHEGNSVVHWCSWAGGVLLLRWLIARLRQEGEDVHAAVATLNHKGCSAAHWAASGGDHAVCRWSVDYVMHCVMHDAQQVCRWSAPLALALPPLSIRPLWTGTGGATW